MNIGRNKNTTTAIEQDYIQGIEQFSSLADYLVINVSSPNTPGLRALQNENELKHLLSSIRTICDKQKETKPLILLKIAPDLNENEIENISSIILQKNTQVDGLIVSNTTIARMDTLKNQYRNETGGLSGRPLKEKALETLRLFRYYTQGKIPLIGVGGIETAEDIIERLKAGANLVQSKSLSYFHTSIHILFVLVYTSLTYSGPPLVNKLNRDLAKLLK